jgi:hypothetical protein
MDMKGNNLHNTLLLHSRIRDWLASLLSSKGDELCLMLIGTHYDLLHPNQLNAVSGAFHQIVFDTISDLGHCLGWKGHFIQTFQVKQTRLDDDDFKFIQSNRQYRCIKCFEEKKQLSEFSNTCVFSSFNNDIPQSSTPSLSFRPLSSSSQPLTLSNQSDIPSLSSPTHSSSSHMSSHPPLLSAQSNSPLSHLPPLSISPSSSDQPHLSEQSMLSSFETNMKVVNIIGSFACNNLDVDAYQLPLSNDFTIKSIKRNELYRMIVEEGYKWICEHSKEEKPGCLLKDHEEVAQKIEVFIFISDILVC